MDRIEILEKSEEIEFDEVKPYLEIFIQQCVDKPRRDRWKFSSKSIDDLSLRFNSLWNGVSTNKADNLSAVKLRSSKYIYLDLDGPSSSGYLLSKENAEVIGNSSRDGMLFAKDKSQAIFLTHEDELFHFRLKQNG